MKRALKNLFFLMQILETNLVIPNSVKFHKVNKESQMILKDNCCIDVKEESELSRSRSIYECLCYITM